MYRFVSARDPAGNEDKKKMKTIIIILAFLLLFSVLMIVSAIRGGIPYGWEDKDGFHYGKKDDEN